MSCSYQVCITCGTRSIYGHWSQWEGKGYWKWRKIWCEVNPKIEMTKALYQMKANRVTNGFANCSAYPQCLVDICHEQSNPEFSDCACKEGRVVRQKRGGSCASFFSLSDVFLFAQSHKQQQEQNQHIQGFRTRQFHSAISGFSDGCWGVTGGPQPMQRRKSNGKNKIICSHN